VVRIAEHPSSTHALKKFWILINKCGNKLKHENDAKGPGALGVDEGCSAPLPIVREKQT
jgi:hypothetical protein